MLNNANVVLVTGAAGFIGYHFSKSLVDAGHTVAGLDNLNDYYDIALKRDRVRTLAENPKFHFVEGDISRADELSAAFSEWRPAVVINLAAQAGVRYSLENPSAYIQSNIVGFANVLEACRQFGVNHLMYASSSSVYGGNVKVPFSESDPVEHPVSLYAATKRSNELMADTYSHLYGIPATGLRFFTVYGEMGRPDMAYYSFSKNYLDGRPIRLFNNNDPANDLSRDFTYVSDVIESLMRLVAKPPSGALPHRILNVGGSQPVSLTSFVATLERALSRAAADDIKFEKIFESIKPGDVRTTFADNAALRSVIGYVPETTLEDGLQRFADWFVSYHGVRRA
ncbi:NAD-dependent epimerase/dehydratase family protein [Dietzia maris]|nr:NAD-dependent epimerase/dehydratase family protein [Dietzia maris]MBB0996447.1 NAD-dependent epimerase/dehydratase family protein [Dietzia maris]